MSYGFDLFALKDGEEVFLCEVMESVEQGAKGVGQREADICQLLQAADSALSLDHAGHETIGLLHEELAITIDFYGNEAYVSIPYFHQGESLAKALQLAKTCLTIIQANTGYQIWDSQLGRLINLESDFEEVARVYSMMTVDRLG